MDLTADHADHKAAPERRPAPYLVLNRTLDALGLALLAWAIMIAALGHRGPEQSGLGVHGLVVIASGVLALPLAGQVLISFGRPGAVPGRRLTMALPLLVLLAAVTAVRFVVGFVLRVPHGSWYAIVDWAGWFDGSAVLVAAIAIALLVIRQARITPQVRTVAGSAAVTTAFGYGVIGILEPWFFIRSDFGLERLPLVVPGLVSAVTSAGLAVVLVRGLGRSAAWAAPGLLLWGLATGLAQVLPAGFVDSWRIDWVLPSRAVVAGEDWAQGAIVVAAAVLLAPVLLMYRRSSPRRRAEMLSGAVIVLGVLLLAMMGTALLQLLASWLSTGSTGISWRQLFALALAGLVGGGLLLRGGIQVRHRSSQPLLLAGAVILVIAHLLGLAWPVLSGGTLQSPGDLWVLLVSQWDGYRLALAVVFPVVVVVLAERLRRKPVAPVDDEPA
jgi:hypothetical protein